MHWKVCRNDAYALLLPTYLETILVHLRKFRNFKISWHLKNFLSTFQRKNEGKFSKDTFSSAGTYPFNFKFLWFLCTYWHFLGMGAKNFPPSRQGAQFLGLFYEIIFQNPNDSATIRSDLAEIGRRIGGRVALPLVPMYTPLVLGFNVQNSLALALGRVECHTRKTWIECYGVFSSWVELSATQFFSSRVECHSSVQSSATVWCAT